jgi:hypothetical protein
MAGVEEAMNDERGTMSARPTVIRSLPPGTVAFDAMGRRVLSSEPGVYFLREAQAQAQARAIRKVVITK